MLERDVDLAQATVGAVTAFVWTALPDYVEGRWALRGAKLALGAGSTGAMVALERERRGTTVAGDGSPRGAAPEPVRGGPLLMAAGMTTSVSSLLATPRVSRAIVRRLRERGVRRPHTALGAGIAALSLAMEAPRILAAARERRHA
ncbi:hypothetical protein [Nocardioides nanhaiensis]|uniref:Uncharacterized protein n=1 Tax=Nocardioides nanhaiensis TaxID=1476871 RepID=A0ABP8WIN1_9ACTN